MSITASIISAILKSVAGNNIIKNGLIKDLVDISIDEVSERGIVGVTGLINSGRAKIERILSKENMKSMNVPEEIADYVVAEIKDLFSWIDITDEILGQCGYDCRSLSNFLWHEYCKDKNDYIEYEIDIIRCLFTVSKILVEIAFESKDFEKNLLIQIRKLTGDNSAGIQKIYDCLEENYSKLDTDFRIALDMLQAESIQKDKEGNISGIELRNNKKQKYIETWNKILFLHEDNKENPITLADAFIMPDFEMHKSSERINFSKKDTLDQIIEKFVKYNRTSTMLIAGIPGIGKSSITSWFANTYKDDDDVIILRFRDWESEELEKGLLKAIYDTLGCKKSDLECKILFIDGFDEMKALNIRDELLKTFSYDIRDLENFKCIITSRPAYIDSSRFQNVINLQVFSIYKAKNFYKKITGDELTNSGNIKSNLEVLGIPVILYMAIMSNVDISKNPTKPELYNRIFAASGGIFDKFSYKENGYDIGNHILSNSENIKKYLNFLQELAFTMFSKKALSLDKEEYHIPQLEFDTQNISILEFPIKYLFENSKGNIEFVHKSIYEYFVSEYILASIQYVDETGEISETDYASMLGNIFVSNDLSKEILEFLKYKIVHVSEDLFEHIISVFNLMLKDGMLYHTNKPYRNITECELRVFSNMLELLHIWGNKNFETGLLITKYVEEIFNREQFSKINLEKMNLSMINLRKFELSGIRLAYADLHQANLEEIDLEGGDLKGGILTKAILVKANLHRVNLEEANLEEAVLGRARLSYSNLKRANLVRANLSQADLEGANLEGANLENANLMHADLTRTNLKDANLSGANIMHAQLKGADLSGATLKEVIVSNDQVRYLKKQNSFGDC